MQTLQTDKHLYEFIRKSANFAKARMSERVHPHFEHFLGEWVEKFESFDKSIEDFVNYAEWSLECEEDRKSPFWGYSVEQLAIITAIRVVLDAVKSFNLRFYTGGSKSFVDLVQKVV